MTAAIDITAEQRKTLSALLRRFIPGVAVWAYGSRVKWTARLNSDLDLVAFTTPAQRNLVSELKDALDESDLPFLVDFHVWDEVPERFHEIIRKGFFVLQEARPTEVKSGMAGEWRSSTWGEEISLEYGKALHGYESANGQYRVFGSNGPIGWTTQSLAPGPGVILGRKGAYRGVQYSADPFFVIDTAYYVVPKAELGMRWLYYAIKHYKLGEVDDGSPIPSTTRAAVYMLDLDVPPPEEQHAIAHILGTLDDKIALNQRMNETLETMARALFKSWFVDFDPVRAKAEGRDLGLPKHLADLFPDSFEDSELGEIPSGWQVGSILDHARLMSGGTPKTDRPEYWGGSIDWASAKDVSQANESFLVETERTITERGLDESATQMIPAFCSVVVARGATTGRMVLFGRDMAMNQTCYALATTTGTPFALYCRLREEIDALVHAAHGSVFDTITTSTFTSSRVVLPPQLVLKAFEERATPAFRCVLRNLYESRTLAALRDTLLPRLISGELRVKEAERFAEAHL